MNIAGEMVRILGKDRVLDTKEDRLAYAFDGTMLSGVPDVVVFPQCTEQVQEVMSFANREGIPVFPRGAGTGLSGGSIPDGGIAMVMVDMNKILEIDRENLLCVVEPGVVTETLQTAAESMGLFYPPDPGSLKACTIGGNIAENAGGPRALKYGVTGDYVLGLTVVTPEGKLVQTGGRTVKNVTGFDLTSLLVGSEGMLGVVTRSTLKLLPRPETARTALASFSSVESAAEAVSEIISRGIIPTALELMDDVTIRCVENYVKMGLPLDAGAILLIEVDGPASTVDEHIAKVASACEYARATRIEVARDEDERDRLWKARRSVSAAVVQLNPTKISEDATVPRSKVAHLVRRIKQIARTYDLKIAVFGHAGDGNLHPNILANRRDTGEMKRVEEAVDALFEAALELGGTLSGEHGIGLMKARYLRKEAKETGIQMMRAIKQALDPNNILNPGKMLWG